MNAGWPIAFFRRASYPRQPRYRQRSSTKLLRCEEEEKWTIGAIQTGVALERVRRDLLRVKRFEDISLLARRALERELRSHSNFTGVGTIEELITCKYWASIGRHSICEFSRGVIDYRFVNIQRDLKNN